MFAPITTKIYLDVDGVINAVQGRIRHSHKSFIYTDLKNNTGWNKWFQVKIDKYWITVSSELVEELANISRIPGVEICWVTSWNSTAITLLSPGIRFYEGNRFDWLDISSDNSVIDNKWIAIKRDMENNPHVEKTIWIDDHHQFLDITHINEAKESSIMLITPRTKYGLTKQDVSKIRQNLSK